MARVARVDIGELASPVFREDGSVIVEAKLTRTGIFTYSNPDGSTRTEYRSPKVVFDAESMASFQLRPVTNNHPPSMLNSKNTSKYQVGTTGQDIRQDGDYMVATLVVTDAKTIKDMKAGKTQVSNGYEAEVDMTPGISPEGHRYDAEQIKIYGNHVAIVHNARAGAGAAIRMDALHEIDPETAKENKMDLEEALKQLGAEKARADGLQAKADKFEAERDAAVQKFDALEKSRQDALDSIEGRVEARVALEAAAHEILGEKAKRIDGLKSPFKGEADRTIMLKVIKFVTDADCDKDADGKTRSDDYVRARFDAACEQATKSTEVFKGAGEAIIAGRKDVAATVSAAAEARQKMIEANKNAWKNLPATNYTKGA